MAILSARSRLPGEGLNLTLTATDAKCTAGVDSAFSTGTNTLDLQLYAKLTDSKKRSVPVAIILTAGKTTWWPWGKVDAPEKPIFDMTSGEGEYTYATRMPLDAKPSDPVFISVSLWEFTGSYINDCLVKGFQLHGPGFVFGGPIDTGQERDDFSNLAGGSLVDSSFKGCAQQFLISRQIAVNAGCP
jgi:hypothetical protein